MIQSVCLFVVFIVKFSKVQNVADPHSLGLIKLQNWQNGMIQI